MLKNPRLELLQNTGFVGRLRRAAIEKMFGGIYPAAIHVTLIKTRLSRSQYEKIHMSYSRASTEWSRAEMELLGAFVSFLNRCRF